MAVSLAIDWKRSAEGFEVVDHGPSDNTGPYTKLGGSGQYGRWFRVKGDLEDYSISSNSRMVPVVQQFVNCKDEGKLLAFLNEYGLPMRHGGEIAFEAEEKYVYEWLVNLRDIAENLTVAHRRPVARTVVNRAFEKNKGLRFWPSYEIRSGEPMFVIHANNLYAYMMLELMLMSSDKGIRLAVCIHCHDLMTTGTGTGKTDRRQFCSDRCRVAHGRQEKKAAAAATAPLS